MNKKKGSSEGVKIKNIQKGDWYNANNPSTPNGSNVYTGASASKVAAEDGQTPGTLLNEINNESPEGANKTNNPQGGGYNGNKPSTPNATEPNGGSNVATDASASTIAEEDSQTAGAFLKK